MSWSAGQDRDALNFSVAHCRDDGQVRWRGPHPSEPAIGGWIDDGDHIRIDRGAADSQDFNIGRLVEAEQGWTRWVPSRWPTNLTRDERRLSWVVTLVAALNWCANDEL